jgi:hypothetical protein
MCTVTLIARHGPPPPEPAVRLVCNRDEQRARPVSTRTISTRCGQRSALMPIDPVSDGTWIGVNDAGVAACLLNRNLGVPAAGVDFWPGRRSRGEIVPSILAAPSVASAVHALAELDARFFPPFRIVVFDTAIIAEVLSDGDWLDVIPPSSHAATWLATSSSLGDHRVQRPRAELFQDLLGANQGGLAAQQRFHNHRWHHRPELSVLMSRPDARTVSRTTIDLCPNAAVLTHVHLDEREGEPISGPAQTARLDLVPPLAGVA